MKICVCGGGNVGMLFCGRFAAAGHEVSLYTRRAARFSDTITVDDVPEGRSFSARLFRVTDDPHEAFADADVVFFTIPSQAAESCARIIAPAIRPGTPVFVVPGFGGKEYTLSAILARGAYLAGLQRVPEIARVSVPAVRVSALGKKPRLFCATLPAGKETELAALFESLVGIPTVPLASYLSVTMTPSNPILHTTRLYGMFSNKTRFDAIPRFYEDWDDVSSEVLLAGDAEWEQIAAAVAGHFPLENEPLRVYYESDTPQKLTKKLSSIPAFAGILTPMVRSGNGYEPDFSDRYFLEDYPFGLKILLEIARLFDISCPTLFTIYAWFEKTVKPKTAFSFAQYGIHSAADFIAHYQA